MRIIIAASSFKLLFAILVLGPRQFLVRHFDIWCFASAALLISRRNIQHWFGFRNVQTLTVTMYKERLTGVAVLCSYRERAESR